MLSNVLRAAVTRRIVASASSRCCGASSCAVAPMAVFASTRVLLQAAAAPFTARAGDWTCGKCNFNNFASRRICFQCQATRTPEQDAAAAAAAGGAPPPAMADKPVRNGDWFCSCGAHNFARRNDCVTCHLPRPVTSAPAGAGGSGASTKPAKPGDWFCNCGAHNFRTRLACMKCTAPRAAGREVTAAEAAAATGGAAAAAAVPWTCPSCLSENAAGRLTCDTCGSASTVAAGGDTPAYAGGAATLAQRGSGGFTRGTNSVPRRAGDWDCAACGFSNFASRASCKTCAAARPAAATAAASGEVVTEAGGSLRREATTPAKPGDWNCACGCHNFATRSMCFRCQTPRPLV